MNYLVNDPLATVEKNDLYVALAFRTAAQFDNPRMHLLHALQGMANELLEIQEGLEQEEDDDYFVKEVGDFVWFLSLYCMYVAKFNAVDADALLRHTFSRAPAEDKASYYGLVTLANKFISMVKKEIFYGKEQTADAIDHAILNSITEVFQVLMEVTGTADIWDIMGKNIAKLSARYPKGHFEQTSAITRDEAAEDAAVRGVQ